MAVDGLMAIFAVTHVERIEPIEERLSGYTVEFYQVAGKMAVYHSTRYATVEVLLKYFLSLLGMAAVADILLVHGVEIATFYPESVVAARLELLHHVLVGIHRKGIGIGNIVTKKYARHPFAGTVLNAESGIDDEPAVTLQLLQSGYRLPFATHVEHDRLRHVRLPELLLTVYVDFEAAFAQLFGGGIEDRGIVADMIGRISAGSHHTGYLYMAHLIL